MNWLKKYKPFIRASAMDILAYRFNILTWALVTVAEVACLIFLWLAVYQSSEGGIDSAINGFTFKEMITYVVLTTIFGFCSPLEASLRTASSGFQAMMSVSMISM